MTCKDSHEVILSEKGKIQKSLYYMTLCKPKSLSVSPYVHVNIYSGRTVQTRLLTWFIWMSEV